VSVVPYEQRTWITLMPAAAELAKQVANTEFVPKGLRGNPAAIAACILYGDELGIGPLQSLAKIAVIEGKPSLSAEAQRALILSAGHDMWVVESTNTKCTVAGRRSNSEHVSQITWSLDDAKRAGLAGRQNWRTYPRQMLMARATAELARLIFADAVGGLLATEELEDGDVEGAEGEAPPATRRKRRSIASPETSGRASEANGATAELPPLPDEFAESGAESIAGATPGTDEPTAKAPSAPDTTGASSFPSPPSDAPVPKIITRAQRARLFAIGREYGVDETHIRTLLLELTGSESTAELNIEDYEALVALIQSRDPVNA
jgi:hypothetical protein